MYPILFHLDDPDVYVRTYWLVVLLGSTVAFVFALPRLRAIDDMRFATIARICLLLTAGALVGGRVHQIVNTWTFLHLRIAQEGVGSYVAFGGLHAGGAIVGLSLAAAFVLPAWRVPAWRFADAMTPAVALGMAFGRFACFLNGCCYGTPCTAPWCVAFPSPSNVWDYHRYRGLIAADATWSAPVHPLQLYFTASALVVMGLALLVERRKRYDGQVALVGLLTFAATNALLEQFRETFPLRSYWFGVPQLTWTLAAIAVIVLATLVRREIAARRSRLAPAS